MAADATPPPDPAKDEGGTDDDDPALGDGGQKALRSERRARAAAERELAEAQRALKERDDAEKSELDRLKGQVGDLEKERDAATAERDRLQVAVSKGLSEADARRVTGAARRLHGTTAEELAEDAEDYFADRPPAAEDTGESTTPPPGATPRERLKPGNGTDTDEPADDAGLGEVGQRMFGGR